MNEVIKTLYKPNCYILISGSRVVDEYPIRVKNHVSLLYDAGEIATEWGVEHGPIQRLEKCDATHPKAREHYFYGYVIDEFGNWSHSAVDDNGLPAAFLRGDLDYIFEVLKRWAV